MNDGQAVFLGRGYDIFLTQNLVVQVDFTGKNKYSTLQFRLVSLAVRIVVCNKSNYT